MRLELVQLGYYQELVSIHAPGRGATPTLGAVLLDDVVSIHAPGRGATKAGILAGKDARVSIHAPGRGATPKISVWLIDAEFQFTHPGGVRPL